MATVHLGRLMGPVGFTRTVAIKRLHAQFAQDPEFVSMFLDEARLAARIRHPNVVPTLDVVATAGELFLVMEYVPGESLARLARTARETNQRMPSRIVSAIVSSVLHGLHAAHEAKSERGEPLGIVHRDVSPQNVLVGTDGASRVLDFGVAKAAGRTQQTRDGQIKGKLSYMAPEQLRGAVVNRQSDIYAAGVVLWELLTGERLFSADNEGALLAKVLEGRVLPPSQYSVSASAPTFNSEAFDLLKAVDQVTLRALEANPERRFATAREMAIALERCVPPATASEVGEWVEAIAADVLHKRARIVAEIESTTSLSLHKDMALANPPGGATLVSPGGEGQPGPGPFGADAGQPTPGDSQLSSISVAGPAGGRSQANTKRNMNAVLATVGAALTVVLLLVGFVATRKKTAAPGAASTVTAVESAAVAEPSPTSTTPKATATTNAAEPAIVAPTPATGAPPAAKARVPKVVGATKPIAPPVTAPAAPTPAPAVPPSDCVYWEKGIKHVNPKCL